MAFTNMLRFFRGLHPARRVLHAAKPASFHTSTLTYSLLELKPSSRQDVKKDCAKDVIRAISWRKKHGIHGGSLALDQIKVIDSIARLPDEIYNPREHEDYILGYKKFVLELFGQLHDLYYSDLKVYVDIRMVTMYVSITFHGATFFGFFSKLLSFLFLQWNSILILLYFLFFCSEDVLLLFYHPFYQSEEEALEFIPTVLYILKNLNGEVFPIPAPRGTFNHGTKMSGQYDWQGAYTVLFSSEKVDILQSISRLPENYRLGFRSVFCKGKNGTPYNNTCPHDELIFYKNVCVHIGEHMKVRVLP